MSQHKNIKPSHTVYHKFSRRKLLLQTQKKKQAPPGKALPLALAALYTGLGNLDYDARTDTSAGPNYGQFHNDLGIVKFNTVDTIKNFAYL